jgi:zinc transport system substrate-binding protein
MARTGRFALILLILVALAAGVWHLAMRREREQPVIPSTAELGPLNVVVTIAPLKGLVEPLLPKGSTVTVLMQPGRSEHGYEFSPADIAAMVRADVLVYVGLHLEGQVQSILSKQLAGERQIVCFADAVGIKPGAEVEGSDHHEADEHHEHGAGFVDPHLWLDPKLVEKLVPKLEEACEMVYWQRKISIWPEQQAKLDAAAEALIEKVRGVDREWATRLAPFKDRPIVTHHNAFSRPAERYGFKVAAVIREFETSEPSPGDIAKVVEAIRKESVRTIFVEPQFNATVAERIAGRAGVKVGHLDPLGDGDWFKMMKSNLDALVSGLSDGQTAGEKPVAKPEGVGK